MRLTAAYRSLSRPSSASCAKASTVRLFHLARPPRLRGGLAFLTLVCFLVQLHIPGPREGPRRSDATPPRCRGGDCFACYAALKVRRDGPSGPGAAAPWVRGETAAHRPGGPGCVSFDENGF